MMRLFADRYLTKVGSLGSPGGDELRWVKPVRPGDTLSVRVTVLKAVASKSKPDRGAVTSFVEVINQASPRRSDMSEVERQADITRTSSIRRC